MSVIAAGIDDAGPSRRDAWGALCGERDMPEIALVYPYRFRHARETMLFHPLGLAQLTASLRKDGLDTSVKDLTFRDSDEVLAELASEHPRVVGIYVMLTMIEYARMLASEIRRLVPGVLLVCGGPMPTLRPQQFLGDFDLVFRGEAAESFPRFCRDYVNAAEPLDVLEHYNRYPGLAVRDPEDGHILLVPSEPSTEEDLGRMPIPDRSDYDHARYQAFWQEREGCSPAGIMTTYGCPYDCEFCSRPIFGSLFRRRNMDSVMEEIRDIRALGYDGLWIADDCLTLDLRHVRAFCHRLIQEDLPMSWTCLSRTREIPLKDIELMKRSGCRKVFFGLESGSNKVLRLMNKHTSVEEAERTLRSFSLCGIETAGFFMIGYPGETRESIETTLAWALRLPLSEISFTIPFPLPGTRLFERVQGVQADADWNYENENRMIYQSDFDNDYLNRRIEETYTKFAERQRQNPL